MGNAHDAVKRLVDHFDQDRKVFLSSDYKEEQLRAEFQARPVTGARIRLTRLTVCLVLFVMTLATGLEPEWNIYLPDSLSGLARPECAVYSAATDKVYVAGSDKCVIVIDCANNKKVARIATTSGVSAMFCSPVTGRLYCAGDVMTVIDCVGDTVVRTLPVNRRALCYNSRSQKLYAYGDLGLRIGESSPIIVDTKTDGIVDTLSVDAASLCYNPQEDKIYCGTEGGVKVFYGRDHGSIVDVPVRGWTGSLCYNPASNKVYCANYDSRNVTVIDGGTNLVSATIVVGPGVVDICCNPRNNKIYLANGAHAPGWPFHEIGDSTVSVIDGAMDKVVATVRTHGRPMVLAYDSASNKVLAACRVGRLSAESVPAAPAVGRGIRADTKRTPSVDIIDGRSNRLTARSTLNQQAAAFCFDPRRRYAYCVVPDRDQPDVVVLAVASGEVLAKLPTARHPGLLCYNLRDNKLYCSIRREGELVVLDGATNRFLARVKTGREPWRLCYNSKDDKVYCDGEYMTRVLVLDGKTDTVISSLMMGSPVWYDSPNNWVYSFKEIWADSRVVVTDGTTGSTIAEVPVEVDWSFCSNPKANKVYCAS